VQVEAGGGVGLVGRGGGRERGREQADGLGESRLEGPAEGGVLEAVAGEDLARGEEVGDESGGGMLVVGVRSLVGLSGGRDGHAEREEKGGHYLFAKQMSAAPRVQRRLEGSKM
jgi:hypothetical protein